MTRVHVTDGNMLRHKPLIAHHLRLAFGGDGHRPVVAKTVAFADRPRAHTWKSTSGGSEM